MKLFLINLLIASLVLSAGCGKGGNKPGAESRYNILLIVMDAQRADHLSCYGYGRETSPNIDRLARSGLQFDRAISQASWTLPSHASLFTGMLPGEHNTHAQHTWLLDKYDTLAELLRKSGYQTVGFSNNPQVGAANNLVQGFDIFVPVWSDTTKVTPRKPNNTEYTNKLVLEFMDRLWERDKPFFMFINYMDVHAPYDPPEPFRSKFLSGAAEDIAMADSFSYNPALVNDGTLTPTESQYDILRQLYDGSTSYLDSKIEELIEHLDTIGKLDSTLVIITADHGEFFGEHGFFTHGVLLYAPLIHVPLIIYNPQLIPQAKKIEQPVALTDIFHTIMELNGIDDYQHSGAPATNLLGPVQSKAVYSEIKESRQRGEVKARAGDTRSVWQPDNLHFILTENIAYESYDLNEDPGEIHNLTPGQISQDSVISTLTSYETCMLKIEETVADLKSSSRSGVDPQQEAALRALGYVGAGGASGGGTEKLSQHGMDHFNQALFHMLKKEYEQARDECRKTIILDPQYRKAHVFIGQLLFHQKKYAEALQHFLKIESVYPGDPEILRLTMVLYAINGREKEAERLYGILYGQFGETVEKFFARQGEILSGLELYKGEEIVYRILNKFHPQNQLYRKGLQQTHLKQN